MSLHSYSRVWLHLIWATLERRPLLFKGAAVKVSEYLSRYASEKGIYMKINYVNPDHVHVLVDLPAGDDGAVGADGRGCGRGRAATAASHRCSDVFN